MIHQIHQTFPPPNFPAICSSEHFINTCVYIAAPKPSFHNDTVLVTYGSNVTLPCTIDVANPSPSYYWERLSVVDSPSEINNTFSDGSLQLNGIQRSGIYQCIAQNDYGSSIQIIELSEF